MVILVRNWENPEWMKRVLADGTDVQAFMIIGQSKKSEGGTIMERNSELLTEEKSTSIFL
jgi:hypothetical protein